MMNPPPPAKMDPENSLSQQFAAHMETVSDAAMRLADPLVRASGIMVDSLLQGGKLISCGNGSCASMAQHFVANMINCHKRERPGLPAITLTADTSTLNSIADELGYNRVFSRQINALGQPGDVLLAITAGVDSGNMASAIEAAIERQMRIVAFTGRDSGLIPERLREQDVEIRVPAEDIARVQEVQLLGIHCLCELIDMQLLGS